MENKPRIFLDTSVIKAAFDKRPVLIPRRKTVDWGDTTVTLDVHEPGYLYPNYQARKRTGERRFEHTIYLPSLAELAKEGKISLLWHTEVLWELAGLPQSNDPRGRFYGAPLESVENPIPYGRVIASSMRKTDYFYEFLQRLSHPRFEDLKRATGAFQGKSKPLNRNQLIDAWHIWCAEVGGADYFLTMDKALINSTTRTSARRRPKIQIIAPLELKEILIREYRLGWLMLKGTVRHWWQNRERGQRPGDRFW